MEPRRWMVFTVVLGLVGGLVVPSPSAAKGTKTPVEMWEVSCLVDPGIEWQSGGKSHIRGRLSQATFYDPFTFTVSGTDTIISNANIHLATGDATLFGTWSAIYLPVSSSGTFDGSWNAKIKSGELVSGKAVGKGTGELRGLKMKLNLESESDIPTGLLDVLASDPPCDPSDILGIIHDRGFIHDPRGTAMPPPKISFLVDENDPYPWVGEGDGSLDLTVLISRSAGPGGASVRCTTGPTGGIDLATAGEDYISVDTTITWNEGDAAPKTCSVPIIDDEVYEPGTTSEFEGFLVQLEDFDGATAGTWDFVEAHIYDNESPPD